ncbi:hypothetical protein ADZ36_05200 [Streptomyces fradiae]|uniref:Uncharacterized protein n=1 Tax=Streptomyces fradiae TaxID=1906 RepID=A0ACC4WG33_STRFR|nr:hypothetical protein ADZ36_05200 [Streptomyces fradiae]OFA61958.1 hypothetical protein BEN35_00570 [Streptomyces fradiae]
MSDFAASIIFLGTTTSRSSAPMETPAGSLLPNDSVRSRPMTAMSPFSSSQISGQSGVSVVFPNSCGDFPRRRLKVAVGSASHGLVMAIAPSSGSECGYCSAQRIDVTML